MWFIAPVLAAGPTYTLSFPEREQHRVHVRAELPAGTTDVFMPTWTPGSYLIREYARHVERVRVSTPDGRALPVRKVTKNRWRIDGGGEAVVVDYDVYARERSVRTNWVDAEIAVLNGAATFLVPDDHEGGFTVAVQRPDVWAGTVTALRGTGPFEAADLDVLMDSPIVVGNPSVESFEVAGVPHYLVDFPPDPAWDSDRAVAGARKVIEATRAFWGELPYERYIVFNWLAAGSGGLEHADSTLMMARPTLQSDPMGHERWLTLLAHEHLHAWNGKRMHPWGLGPFDYEREAYTPDLWIVEGFTSYLDDLLLVRAGLVDQGTYLQRLSDSLRQLERTPGRRVSSVSQASHDAWIKHYRPNENTPNTTVSYYTKGALIAWLLDAHIRAATGDRRSLDDALRGAYGRLAGQPGYTPEAIRDALSEAVDLPLQPLLEHWADTTEELDITPALEHFGLERQVRHAAPSAWLGLTVEGGRVTRVRRDGPAAAGGVNVDDELLALDGTRIDDLDRVLEDEEPGRPARLLVARGGQLLTLDLVLGTEPAPVGLQIRSDATRAQVRARERWLTGR